MKIFKALTNFIDGPKPKKLDQNDKQHSGNVGENPNRSRALGSNPRKNPLSQTYLRNRQHLKESVPHADAFKTWRLHYKAVFVGEDSTAKRKALEDLLNVFCRELNPTEQPALDDNGNIRKRGTNYKALCSGQKESMAILRDQFSTLTPEDQASLAKTFIDKHMQHLGFDPDSKHDPQLRGIELVQEMMRGLGDRHEERAQVLSHLLLKLNQNDLHTQVHGTKGDKAEAIAMGAIGVATAPMGVGVGVLAYAVWRARQQEKSINAAITVVHHELEHARSNWNAISEGTTQETLKTNYAKMLTGFRKDDSSRFGTTFQRAFSDKYYDPENFDKWNKKSDDGQNWGEVKHWITGHRESKIDAVVANANTRLKLAEIEQDNVPGTPARDSR